MKEIFVLAISAQEQQIRGIEKIKIKKNNGQPPIQSQNFIE